MSKLSQFERTMSTDFVPTDDFVSEHTDSIRQRIADRMGSDWGAQARVSRETGYGRAHVSTLMSGKRTLRMRHVQKFARALNVSERWLLTGEGHPGDVDAPPPPEVSNRGANPGTLSLDQVGKLLAAAERERLTPDQRALLAEYDALPPGQRDLFWRLLRSAQGEHTGHGEPPVPAKLNDGEQRKGKG